MIRRLRIARLLRLIARNDPPQGWDRYDKREWA